MSIARHIRALRRKHGESLQVVADAVGVSKAHIWELEKGKSENPSITLVTRLADHFQVTVAYLVGEDINSTPADRDLRRLFRRASQLDERERAIMSSMVQSLIENRPKKQRRAARR